MTSVLISFSIPSFIQVATLSFIRSFRAWLGQISPSIRVLKILLVALGLVVSVWAISILLRSRCLFDCSDLFRRFARSGLSRERIINNSWTDFALYCSLSFLLGGMPIVSIPSTIDFM